ncbi:hypothetical protein Salmuc_04410 [Salipiger mucosus DSM 16094]|uniref:Uncharacterized protein n=1 Tax=Salipiger mucosus DSM 16094 TaxID=1123237 RepID=S9QG27_9RHOB|nr:hypothetical protein Salmuc_04410 [Salipiger mucosus DSM 16094]
MPCFRTDIKTMRRRSSGRPPHRRVPGGTRCRTATARDDGAQAPG